MKAAADLRRARAITLATVSFTVCVSYGVLLYAFPVLLKPMSRDLGWSTAQLSGALSLALVVSGIAAFPAGRAVDRGRARLVMTSGSLAAAGALLLWSQVHSLWQLYSVFALLGVAMALVLYDLAFTVIAHWFAPNARSALTVVTVVGGLASAVFTPLTAVLLQALGWRATLGVLAGVLVMSTAIPHALFVRSAPEALAEPPSPQAGARQAARTVAFWALTASLVIGYFISVGLVVHLVPLLLERGYALKFAALAAGLMGLLQIAGRALTLPLGKLLAPGLLGPFVFVSQAVALLGLAAAGDAGLVLAAVVLVGASKGVIVVLRGALFAELFGAAAYGAISGFAAIFINAAMAAAPWVIALLHAGLGGYGPVLVVLAGASVVGGGAALVAERAAPRSADLGVPRRLEPA